MRMLLIDRNERTPVRRQIYEQMKTQILCGELRGAEALPSTRQLAGRSRHIQSTVVEAYDMLLVGRVFLLSRQGAPTVVAPGLVMERSPKPPAERSRETTAVRANFQTGRPDLLNFPRRQWGKAFSSAALELPARQYGYTGPQGYEPLRREISEWLLRSRGFLADAEDVFITAGATHALRILADLFCAGGGSMLMEDPCHKGLYDTLRVGGCRNRSCRGGRRTHANGPPAADRRGGRRICNALAPVSHGRHPAGRTARGADPFCKGGNIYIIEDDYDSEFRFAGERLRHFAQWTRSASCTWGRSVKRSFRPADRLRRSAEEPSGALARP
jgi:GntR family transcriptional regulator/MocR family aminotransferase